LSILDREDHSPAKTNICGQVDTAAIGVTSGSGSEDSSTLKLASLAVVGDVDLGFQQLFSNLNLSTVSKIVDNSFDLEEIEKILTSYNGVSLEKFVRAGIGNKSTFSTS